MTDINEKNDQQKTPDFKLKEIMAAQNSLAQDRKAFKETQSSFMKEMEDKRKELEILEKKLKQEKNVIDSQKRQLGADASLVDINDIESETITIDKESKIVIKTDVPLCTKLIDFDEEGNMVILAFTDFDHYAEELANHALNFNLKTFTKLAKKVVKEFPKQRDVIRLKFLNQIKATIDKAILDAETAIEEEVSIVIEPDIVDASETDIPKNEVKE